MRCGRARRWWVEEVNAAGLVAIKGALGARVQGSMQREGTVDYRNGGQESAPPALAPITAAKASLSSRLITHDLPPRCSLWTVNAISWRGRVLDTDSPSPNVISFQ